jgi:choline dehydrogenase-like flavoprotein
MTASAEPNVGRPTDEMVDVLIIGAGASGAVLAASLAETRMKILCLEQGDWVKSNEFPANGRDWEARRYADFDLSPNRRGRDTDYPVNDDNSIMKIAN